MFENLVPRFIKYVKVNTRSDDTSGTIPSTQSQVEFAHMLVEELKDLGMSEVIYNEESGFVTATLPANIDREVPTIGFIAHMDTADFNAENVNPQIVEDYDGVSDIVLDKDGKYVLNSQDFPNLANYKGQTLITTDGSTLLGSDDKSGIAEIITAMEYLIANPDIKHGDLKVAFGPDEEIGTGANNFDVEKFGSDFAYTLDGGPLGELQYETFNAASARVSIAGRNVHPGVAKDKMINAIKLGMQFDKSLPDKDVPEKTEKYEGFFLLESFDGGIEETRLDYIIRDHDKDKFEARKKSMEYIANKMNKELGEERIKLEIKDSYYNMKEVIKKNMHIVELAEQAMFKLDIDPIIEPVRGGTDGSRLSFMALPTPNIFAGGENMHGRFEFVAVETMEKATQVVIEIASLNAKFN